jgi:hypothetical protein
VESATLRAPMKNLRFLVPVLALFALQGCIYHRGLKEAQSSPPKSKKSKSNSKECHPSQYWDGDQCRHKGKGHGARKHDD